SAIVSSPTAPLPLASSYSRLKVIDLTTGRPLRVQLAEQAARIRKQEKKMLVTTMAPGDEASLEVARALTDVELQNALASTTVIVRIDAQVFADELGPLGLTRPNLPWFFLLGPSLTPIDAISADEWDDNTPANVSPVLKRFVAGTLAPRRALSRDR
ncbi:MAG: hypothetical protein WCI05_08915, partial [Myxococcales bacterium]